MDRDMDRRGFLARLMAVPLLTRRFPSAAPEQAQGPDGTIAKDGQVYSPMADDKTGFTDPEETEFHFVAHTTEPDSDNFPPHTAWIRLHFSDVDVLEKPADVTIPYTTPDDR